MESIELKIIVDEEILEMSDEENQSYEWQFKIRICLAYKSTHNLTYAKPQENTIVSESWGKTYFPFLYKKGVAALWLMGPSVKNMCNIILYFNTQSQSRKQKYIVIC